MGEFMDKLTGKDATERSQELLAEKFPAHRGLSQETLAEVIDGDAEIMGDDPQSEHLRDLTKPS